ncbi:MAG: hypothetical protein ACKPEA_01555, partial [Planctomycetota bacterium]
HRDRARVGKHLHIEDLRNLIPLWKGGSVVVVHVSRRTNMQYARERLAEAAGEHAPRVHLLMDHRMNRQRYERQAVQDAGTAAGDSETEPAAAKES